VLAPSLPRRMNSRQQRPKVRLRGLPSSAPLQVRCISAGIARGAHLREGCAPEGPGRRRARIDAEESHACPARRWPGAVGNSCIVAYGARSPVWRLSAKHAQTRGSIFSIFQKHHQPPPPPPPEPPPLEPPPPLPLLLGLLDMVLAALLPRPLICELKWLALKLL